MSATANGLSHKRTRGHSFYTQQPFLMRPLTAVLSFFLLVTRVLGAISAEQLLELQSDDGVIRITDENFMHLLNGPREYYVSILFTALSPEINCDVCGKFEPVYGRIARSYQKSNPGKNAVFFLEADFSQNQKAYNALQMTQVPRVWLFPPSELVNYNVSSPHFPYKIGDKALSDPLDFANFISQTVSVNIVVQDEFDPYVFLQYFAGTFVFVLILKKKVLARLARGAIFRILSVVSICILTGGYMFTVIRGVPLIAKNDKGEIMHFSGGAHWQFGLETFIIAGMYLLFVVLMNILCIRLPSIDDPRVRNFGVIFASFAVFWLFNQLTKIYLVKDPGYPYGLTNYI